MPVRMFLGGHHTDHDLDIILIMSSFFTINILVMQPKLVSMKAFFVLFFYDLYKEGNRRSIERVQLCECLYIYTTFPYLEQKFSGLFYVKK